MKKLLPSLLLLATGSAQAAPAPLVFGAESKAQLLQKGLRFPQSATPASPASGYDYLYFKSDNNLYCKNPSGTETQISGLSGGSGDVTGPASSTADAIAVFNGTTGKTIKNSLVTISGSTVIGSLTGAASSNVLKAGDTMTGPINMPAGAANTAEVTGGTSNTGFFFPTSSTAAFTSAGTELWRTGSGGITIGNTTAQTARLYITNSSSTDTGIVLESGTTAGRKFVVDFSGANTLSVGRSGTNYFLNVAHTATGGTGANWWNIGLGDNGSIPAYPGSFVCTSANGNVTALSSIKSLDGATINGAPWVVLQNLNATANTIAQYVTTGSSKAPMAAFGSRHITQTSTAEDADIMLSNQNAGTLTEHLRIKPKGQFVSLGTAPAVGTCGTSPGTPTGNDNFFKITSGTGGSSGTCAVTLATPPLNAGHCLCRDKTTVSTVVDADVSGSTVTMTTYSRTTGTAANFAASDVFECQCQYF